mgnify:CR=1 FL=1
METSAQIGKLLSVTSLLLDQVNRCFERAGAFATIRLHGDCHMGNVLWTDSGAHPGPHFVDFDDSRMGPAIQDLWMLLPGEPDAARHLLNAVLDGYEQIAEFDDRELRLIEPLRTMRMIHHSAWLAERWADPAFPAAFPWFGTGGYWGQQTTQLHEQIEAMEGS